MHHPDNLSGLIPHGIDGNLIPVSADVDDLGSAFAGFHHGVEGAEFMRQMLMLSQGTTVLPDYCVIGITEGAPGGGVGAQNPAIQIHNPDGIGHGIEGRFPGIGGGFQGILLLGLHQLRLFKPPKLVRQQPAEITESQGKNQRHKGLDTGMSAPFTGDFFNAHVRGRHKGEIFQSRIGDNPSAGIYECLSAGNMEGALLGLG